MITSNIDYERCSCSTKNTPEIQEVKAIGIFEQMRETNEVLTEVLYMLDRFKREIRNYPVPEEKCNAIEATCLRDEVTMVNEKAFAIKGDLERIMAEFH